MDNETKNVRVTINMDKELKAKIKAKADKENRSVSNWIKTVIQDKLKSK